MRIVLDTSVLVAATRSRRGASFAILSSIPSARFQVCLSVGLYTEWQAVLTRSEHLPPGTSRRDALEFLRYLASRAHLQDIHFLWRPCLRDPNDDMLVELAVAANCRHIVTHNLTDFCPAKDFGIEPIAPREFLQITRSKA